MQMRKNLCWIIALGVPPIILTGLWLFEPLLRLVKMMGDCPFYALLGKYCPGCGNTRSVTALAGGDILGSLRHNVSVIYFCLLGLAFYTECVCRLFGKELKIIPRHEWFIYSSLIFFGVYFIIRNFIPYLTP
jgi:hypothetical protein